MLSTTDNQFVAKNGGRDGARRNKKAFNASGGGGGGARGVSDYPRQSSRYSPRDTDGTVPTDNSPTGYNKLPGNAGAGTTSLASASSVGGADGGTPRKASDIVGFFVSGALGMVLGVAMYAAYRGVPRRGYNRLLS